MTKYRKRPVEVEAWQFKADGANLENRDAAIFIAAWCGGRVDSEAKASDPTDVAYWITIPTLEGLMKARPGDWIIRGVKGEFYPCKPDIFEATYEPVEAGVEG